MLLAMEADEIRGSLEDLHAIISVPDDGRDVSRPIRLHHYNFRDFIFDRKRCIDPDFWIDERSAHRTVAENCLRLMSEKLKRDICELHSPGRLVQDIDRARIEQYIPKELQCACLHWVEHFRQSGLALEDNDSVHQFFKKHFLHWLEVMLLLRKGSEMAAVIRMYQSLLMVRSGSKI